MTDSVSREAAIATVESLKAFIRLPGSADMKRWEDGFDCGVDNAMTMLRALPVTDTPYADAFVREWSKRLLLPPAPAPMGSREDIATLLIEAWRNGQLLYGNAWTGPGLDIFATVAADAILAKWGAR